MAKQITNTQSLLLAAIAAAGQPTSQLSTATRKAFVRKGLVREVAQPAGEVRNTVSNVWVEITDAGRAAL